ncbi:monocarboxylate transporter 13-like [Acanthaster planci]|uniref:Monocarboxylate transporter 13-like n=1 Tax=Acanthaster planci TaxID=133434 RepID=A0A8B7XYZ2_ACAPL|nr:monocarboxylate transporter 13-like [Acanthaster planci]
MSEIEESQSRTAGSDSGAEVRHNPSVIDGGWGWLVVLGGFATFILWSGLLKGLGVLLSSVTTDLTQNTGLTGEMIAILAGIRSLGGPFAGPIGDKFGYRLVVMTTSFSAALGIIFAAFTHTTMQFLICLAVISGVSFSAPTILTKAMIGRYFHHRFALAIGLASAGDSLSMVLIAPMMQVLLDTYGWRGALLIQGGLCLHLIAVGALLRDPPMSEETQLGYTSIPNEDKIVESSEQTDQTPASSKSFLKTFNFSVLTKLVFWVICLVMTGTYLISILWYLYFVPHAEAKGFTPGQAVTFVAVAGVGQIVTKIAMGKLIDKEMISSRVGLVLCITTCSLTLVIDPLLHTFWPMMIVTTIFGSSFGMVFCLVDVFAKEIAGNDGLASALGFIDLIGGISRIFLGFAPGWIYEKSGSYDTAFVFIGGLYLTTLLPLVTEWIIDKR